MLQWHSKLITVQCYGIADCLFISRWDDTIIEYCWWKVWLPFPPQMFLPLTNARWWVSPKYINEIWKIKRKNRSKEMTRVDCPAFRGILLEDAYARTHALTLIKYTINPLYCYLVGLHCLKEDLQVPLGCNSLYKY